MRRKSLGWRPLRQGAVATGLIVALLLMSPTVLAAPSLQRGTAEISVEGDQATVWVQYQLQNDDAQVTAVPLTVLRFAGTAIEDLRVSTPGGEALPLDVAENGPALNVQVPITESSGSTFEMVAEYRVKAALSRLDSGMRQVVIPILAPKWGPAGQGEVFEARVRVPGGVKFIEGFPVSPTAIELGESTTTLVYRMPVVPSMIRAAVTDGAVPFWTLQRVLDVGVLLVLVVGALAAYQVVVRRPRYVADPPAS